MTDSLRRFLDSDIWHKFKRDPLVITAVIVGLILILSSAFAPLFAPHSPFDLKTLNLSDAFTPPAWIHEGKSQFMLGTDDQGRDVLSTIMYGSRASMLIGITLGLISGYFGGALDAFIMRVADVQLSFPAILIALLISGVARVIIPNSQHDQVAIYVLIFAIAASGWVQYARTVRGSTLVERNKEYVQAARVIGRRPLAIMFSHVLPNVLGPVMVLATLHIGTAIITEATLSYLGVGMPATQPTLGTMIRIGGDFLLSGEWWILWFPGTALVILVLSINIIGDWLRDAINPKLR
jgi:peptide/nickel transport system permease protein